MRAPRSWDAGRLGEEGVTGVSWRGLPSCRGAVVMGKETRRASGVEEVGDGLWGFLSGSVGLCDRVVGHGL